MSLLLEMALYSLFKCNYSLNPFEVSYCGFSTVLQPTLYEVQFWSAQGAHSKARTVVGACSSERAQPLGRVHLGELPWAPMCTSACAIVGVLPLA